MQSQLDRILAYALAATVIGLTSDVAREYAKQSEGERGTHLAIQPAHAQRAATSHVMARKLETRLAYDVLLRVERIENIGGETVVRVAASGERGSQATLLGPVQRTTYLADQDGHIYGLIRVTGSGDVRLVPETELYARFVRTSRGGTAYQTNNSIYKLRKDEALRFALHFERVRRTATTLQFRYSDSAPISLTR